MNKYPIAQVTEKQLISEPITTTTYTKRTKKERNNNDKLQQVINELLVKLQADKEKQG